MPSFGAASNKKLVTSRVFAATSKRYSCTGVGGTEHLQSPPVLSFLSAHVKFGFTTRQALVAVPRFAHFPSIGKLLHDAATSWPASFLQVLPGAGSRT